MGPPTDSAARYNVMISPLIDATSARLILIRFATDTTVMSSVWPTSAPMAARLDREQAHFDAHYVHEANQGVEPLSAFDHRRYTNPPAHTLFPREYFYHLLAPLTGKRTLEIACGNGIDASICAHNGAKVHAYDLSPQSIAMTRKRAEVNGLSDRMTLETGGDLRRAFPGETFDAIMGYAALHHLPATMGELAHQVRSRLNPGGVAVFAEPVINSKALHAVRRAIPLAVAQDTEDEQPLTDANIAAFARPFDRMVRREFQMISRIWPLLPPNCWALTKSLHWMDAQLLKWPALRRFATVVVFAVYRD